MRKKVLFLVSILLVFMTSLAYSALSTSLSITSEVRFRVLADIRVNSVGLSSATNSTIGYESAYSKNTVSNGFILPGNDSSISYIVHIDNTGDVPYTIYDITRTTSDNNLVVTVSGYNLYDVIPAKTSVDLVLTYTTTNPSNSVINVVETFDFRRVYKVRYYSYDSQLITQQDKIQGVDLALTLPAPTKPGYTFSKWNTKANGTGMNYNSGSSYTIDDDLDLYARYTLDTYTITYNLDGGTNHQDNPATYTYEDSDITLGDATKTGYIFNGWTGNGITTPTKNLVLSHNSTGNKTFTANWEIIPYTITYALNNGTVAIANPTGYDVETATFTLNNPTKTLTFKGNYNATSGTNAASGQVTIGANTTAVQTFKGWSGTDLTGETNQTVTVSQGSTGNRSYTAHWTAVAPTSLPTVSRDGFTCGWSTSSTGTTIEYDNSGNKNYTADLITEGQASLVNLYAVCVPDTYTLTINPQDGTYDGSTSNASKEMTYDAATNNDIGIPTRTGYTFNGWYTQANGGTQIYGSNGRNAAANGYWSAAYSSGVWKKEADVTVYAHWSKDVSSLTNTLSETHMVYNASAQGPTVTVKDDNTTLASGTDYTISGNSNTNIGQYAITITGANAYNATTKAYYTGTTTLTYYINNAALIFDKGSCDSTTGTETLYTRKGATVVYTGIRETTTTGTIPTISKQGYTFQGWYTQANGGGSKVLTSSNEFTGTAVTDYTNANSWQVTADHELYAHCTIDNHTVTYNCTANGGTGTIANATVAYGDSIDLTKTCTPPSGFTQIGWHTTQSSTTALSSSTIESADVTLYAIYKSSDSLTADFAANNGAIFASTTQLTCYRFNNGNSCTVTVPNITAQSNFTAIGINTSTGSTSNNSSYNTSSKVLTLTTSNTGSTWYPITKSSAQYTGTFSINDTNAATGGGSASCYRYNGANSCTITASTLTAKPGYTALGWNTTKGASSATVLSGQTNLALTGNTQYWSVTYYNTEVTITFNPNTTNSKTISQTHSGTTVSATASPNTISVTCNKYNGSTTCSITSPTITAATGYNVVGYNTAANATTSTWNVNTEVNVSLDATYYAITAGNSYSIKFNSNCPSGTTASGTMADLAMTYGVAKNLTSNAFGCTNREFVEWNTKADGTGTSYADGASVSNLTSIDGDVVNLYAKWRLITPAPSISGGATKIYGTSATTLTCSESTTTYPIGYTKYYSFGYSTTASGTPSNWTTADTSNTLSISATEFLGTRYYACRVYVMAGTETSSTVVTSAKTTMILKNAKLTFNSGNCGTISGTNPGYVNTSMTGLYTGETDETAGTIPTVNVAAGKSFNGWYTPTTTSSLPSGYTPVDYIEGTGTQYIDTGYKATPTTGVEIDYQFSDINPYQQRLFGEETSSTDYLNYHMYINGVGNWAYAFIDGAGNWINTGVAANTNRHTIKFNTTSGKVIIDSTTLDIASSTRTKTTQSNMLIFSAANTGSPNAKIKVYSFKMYSSNSSGLVRNMIPCIKDSTGEVGMYDLVGNTFYGNAGTGQFIAGSNTQVIASNGTINSSVSGWTSSDKKWLITADKTLIAKCTPNYTVTFNYQNNIYNQNPLTWTINGNSLIDSDYQYNNTISASVSSNASLYTGLKIPLNSDKKANTNYRFSITAKRTGSISGNLRGYAETRDSSNNVITWHHYINVNNSTTTANTWKELSATFNSGNYSTWDKIQIDYDTANQGPVYVSNIRLDEYTTQTKNYGGSYDSMPTPTRTGYAFQGWYTAASGGTEVTSSTVVSKPGDHTLYAHWTPNNYTLTVAPNSGSFNGSTSNTTYTQSFDTQKVLPLPTRTGYIFNGWSQSGSGTLTKFGTPKFGEPYGSIGVYNNAGGGTVTHTSVARSSDSPILTSANMLQIKTAGTASPGLGGFYQLTQSRANAVFYHVIVAKIPVGYKIQHAQNQTGDGRIITWLTPQDGTGKFEVYIYRHTCGSSGTFSTFGHVYLNGTAATSSNPVTWYVAYANVFDYSAGVPNSASQVFRYGAGNTTLTANWTASKIKLTLNQNGGSGGTTAVWYYYNTNKFYSNEACTTQITSITKPTKSYYTFDRYNGDGTSGGNNGERYIYADGTFASDLYYDIYKDATLNAVWTPTNYTISSNYNSGGNCGNPTSYNVESNAITLCQPTRTGYTFAGWTGTGLSSATKSVTIPKGSSGNRSYTATWTANSYYLDVNGIINNKSKGSTAYCGTFDVYINGSLKSNDVTDYYASWTTGTTYSISDIKAISGSGCTYNGVYSGSTSGTITGSNVTTYLKFTFSSKSYGYTGGMQSFVAPIEGTYKLQVWGAAGGNHGSITGGKGGYSYGNKALTVHQTIYIGVGQQPSNAHGGYNGGGYSSGGYGDTWNSPNWTGGGGGATHIGSQNAILKNTTSSNVYIVAGGGGGSGETNNGGNGGGTTGQDGNGVWNGRGGTQTAGGAGGNESPSGSYGQGAGPSPLDTPECGDVTMYWAGGGGGGWYGGGAGDWSTVCWEASTASSRAGGGGGGSGYIGGVTGTKDTQRGQRSGSGYATISFVS